MIRICFRKKLKLNKTIEKCKNQMRKDLPSCLYEGNKCEAPKIFLLKHGDETTKEYDSGPSKYKEA
jgi:hypothetical protein